MQATGEKPDVLGLHSFLTANVLDSNKSAVSLVNEIRQKQYENAKKAGVVDVAKWDAHHQFEQEQAKEKGSNGEASDGEQ